jgi:hypothetical protein
MYITIHAYVLHIFLQKRGFDLDDINGLQQVESFLRP